MSKENTMELVTVTVSVPKKSLMQARAIGKYKFGYRDAGYEVSPLDELIVRDAISCWVDRA